MSVTFSPVFTLACDLTLCLLPTTDRMEKNFINLNSVKCETNMGFGCILLSTRTNISVLKTHFSNQLYLPRFMLIDYANGVDQLGRWVVVWQYMCWEVPAGILYIKLTGSPIHVMFTMTIGASPDTH